MLTLFERKHISVRLSHLKLTLDLFCIQLVTVLLSMRGENSSNLPFLTFQAESHGNFDEEVCGDHVDIEYSETSESQPPKACDNENQEKQTEEPQVVSMNRRESNGRVAVMCAESSSQSSSLEGGDPQPQAVDTYSCNRHHINQRAPVTSKCL